MAAAHPSPSIQRLGGALGIAIFSAISTSRAHDLLAAHAPIHEALTSGFQRALLACCIFIVAAAVIALRARGAPVEGAVLEPAPVPDAA